MTNSTLLCLVFLVASFSCSHGRFAFKLIYSPRPRHPSLQDYRGDVVADASNNGQFMVNISLGEPPVPQLLVMDSGSDLLWTQCLPCINCFKQFTPIFDPSKSSTYKTLPCTSPSCTVGSSEDKCDPNNNCEFDMTYADGSTANGVIATEKVTLTTSDEGMTSVLDVLIGCGHENQGIYGQTSGVLGLGPENVSLVRKLGSKFSYCIGNIRDPQYSYNQLILGNDAVLQGDNTPLDIYNGFYYLTMEGIRIGEKRLNIDRGAFERTASGEGGTVIDSGTTVSFLVEAAYEPLSAEVISLLQGKLERVNDPTFLCYKGDISRDLTGFPVVTFEFAGGAELGLDVLSLFIDNGSGEFCMAVQESRNDDQWNMIGVLAQQNYNVGYDLVGKQLTFQRIDCQLLELSI
ncbi:hypothetical protein SLE2022_273320 [Rubroshorea leprosula]